MVVLKFLDSETISASVICVRPVLISISIVGPMIGRSSTVIESHKLVLYCILRMDPFFKKFSLKDYLIIKMCDNSDDSSDRFCCVVYYDGVTLGQQFLFQIVNGRANVLGSHSLNAAQLQTISNIIGQYRELLLQTLCKQSECRIAFCQGYTSLISTALSIFTYSNANLAVPSSSSELLIFENLLRQSVENYLQLTFPNKDCRSKKK